MSSFIKAQKSRQRLHRERVNVLSNGFLERKKDYKTRAAEYNRRKDIFTRLRKKALNKNPDEFFFRMKSSHLVDGIHYDILKDDEFKPEELQLIQSQDFNYINYKRSIYMNKIPKLQSELHWLDSDPNKPKNTHTFFVEDKKKKKHFNIEQINSNFCQSDMINQVSQEDLETSNEVKELKYRRLRKKIARETFLRGICLKMQIKKHLLNKKDAVKKIKKGTKHKTGVYEWKMERKK